MIVGLLAGGRRRLVDPVQDAGVGDLLDEVDDVVEAADELVDVLAVERRDEGVLELVPDVVADPVAALLEVAQLAGEPLALVVGAEELLEHPRAGEDVLGVLDEELEELLLAGNEGKAHRFARDSWNVGRVAVGAGPMVLGAYGIRSRSERPAITAAPMPASRSQLMASAGPASAGWFSGSGMVASTSREEPASLADGAERRPPVGLIGLDHDPARRHRGAELLEAMRLAFLAGTAAAPCPAPAGR